MAWTARFGRRLVSPYHFGLNVGPIVLMIENYRSGLVWQLARGCRWIEEGLRRAGFSGGWLQTAPAKNVAPGEGLVAFPVALGAAGVDQRAHGFRMEK